MLHNYDSEILAGYFKGMNHLLINHPKTAEYAGAIGQPVESNMFPTVAVVLHGEDVELHVSAEYFAELTAPQAGAVLAHEFDHVVLNHLNEARMTDIWPHEKVLTLAHECVINDRLALAGFELPDDAVFGEKITGENYAGRTTDYTYNSILDFLKKEQENEDKNDSDEESEGGEGDDQNESSQSGSQGGGGSSSGNPSDGDSQSSEGDQSGNSDGQSGDSQEGSEDGDQGGGQPKDAQLGDGHESGSCGGLKVIDENGNVRDATEAEVKKAVGILNKKVAQVFDPKDDQFQNGAPEMDELKSANPDLAKAISEEQGGDQMSEKGIKGVGDDAASAESILSDKHIAAEWVKLLSKVNPKVGRPGGMHQMRATADWSRRPRVLSMIPNVVLPVMGDASKREGFGAGVRPPMLLALDFSGSIDRAMTNVMAALARSVPEEHIDVTCVTFSTYTEEFDHKSDHNSVAGGGTDFTPVHLRAQRLAAENKGVYPYVVCFTDGEARFTGAAPDQLTLDEKWLWVDVESKPGTSANYLFNSYGANYVRQQKNLSPLPYTK